MKKDIAAVVVTYNRKELLIKSIESLLAQTCADRLEIIVIDNASTDGTKGTIQKLIDDQKIIYINTGTNIGGAGGFNLGMRRAVELGYDYIWVMDDDCLPYPDALEKLIAADTILGGDYGWLSSKCLWKDGSLCKMNIQRSTPFSDIKSFENTIIPAQLASFVSLFVKAGIIKQYGLPIKDFFIWSDDWEFTRRVSFEEKCFVVTDSRVVHAMQEQATVSIDKEKESDRIKRYFYFYRNDVFLYKREGLKGWIWILFKDLWHSIKVIMNQNTDRKQKLKTIWRGKKEGINFDPEIEFI